MELRFGCKIAEPINKLEVFVFHPAALTKREVRVDMRAFSPEGEKLAIETWPIYHRSGERSKFLRERNEKGVQQLANILTEDSDISYIEVSCTAARLGVLDGLKVFLTTGCEEKIIYTMKRI